MKKLFLLSIGTALSFSVLAQKAKTSHSALSESYPINISHSGERTTAIGSVDTLSNIASNDTASLYYAASVTGADSGFISGMDAYGDMGYAERFDFNTGDSSLSVEGVVAVFGGTVSASSTKKVKFYAWSVGAQIPLSSTVFYSGLPNVALDSVAVNYTALGITPGHFGVSINMFAAPTAYLNHSFFVGCTLSYDNTNFGGDTIGLATSQIGKRSSVEYTVSGADTIINNQSVSLYIGDTTWDDNWASNFQIPYDFYLFPIVKVGTANLSVNGITKNGFTFFGSYPNPATDVTNIKFSIANSTDVTITITDAAGHTVNTVNETNLSAGTHIVPVSTSNLPAGDYIYLVRTATGEGMASKLSVIK